MERSLNQVRIAGPAFALLLIACGGTSAPAGASGSPAAAVTSAATTPAATTPPVATTAAPTVGTATAITCTGVVSDSFVSSRFGLQVGPAAGSELPAGSPQLAPGLQQHVCSWRIPGAGALAATFGRITIAYGSYPDATAVTTELDKVGAKDAKPISGVGAKAYQGSTSSTMVVWIAAASGTKYVISSVITGEPDVTKYEEAVRALAREVIDKT
ncbi:MAG: hypothetical protein M3O91_00730 [Chloroflexota bacterium]|nr:hypothetical protein [Chloroflexota bacterium]